MPRKIDARAKDFVSRAALLVGFGFAIFLLWITAFVVLTGLIFTGLTFFTNLNFGARIGGSLVSSTIVFRMLGLFSASLDFIRATWIAAKKNDEALS